MTKEELSRLSDEALLEESKKVKKAAIISALVIGVMIGVVIYSVAKNTVGFFTLIPLFFIYKLTRSTNSSSDLEKLLKERNLDK